MQNFLGKSFIKKPFWEKVLSKKSNMTTAFRIILNNKTSINKHEK